MKSQSTMLIEEVHKLSYQANAVRVILRNVTDEEIEAAWQLPPSAVRLEIVCHNDRAKWYMEHCGEYVTMDLRKRAT